MGRGTLTYWHWPQRPIAEREAVRAVLAAAGVNVTELRSRVDDPPDCEALIDGERCGIEHTELLHEAALRMSERAHRAEPQQSAQHFVWDRETFLAAVQRTLDRKNERLTRGEKGGPYHRRLLVIVTDEPFLYRTAVDGFLEGSSFRTDHLDEAYLGLSYHPGPGNSGSCPVYKLTLTR